MTLRAEGGELFDAAAIDAAVADGVLDAQQAERLLAFLRSRAARTDRRDPDDERFRLVGGFNDIFVTIGIGLVFAPLAFLFGSSVAFPFIGAIVAWVLAEIFTRQRRMALPSIALAIGFAGFCGACIAPFLGSDIWTAASTATDRLVPLAAVAAALGAGVHYARFRVPIDGLLVFAALQGAIAWIIASLLPGWFGAHLTAYVLIVGLVAFGLAMAFDVSDPARVTHRSDIAFWLHLVAAPLIVHGMLAGVVGASRFGGEQAWPVLALTCVFTLIALVVDRRALIVSALTYAGGAIGYLINRGGGFWKTETLSPTLLLLGAAILLLSIGWRGLRARIVPLLPLGTLRQRLPPIHAS